MTITAQIFEAFLKCPTKCWLRAKGEASPGGTYSDWVQIWNESYRADSARRLSVDRQAAHHMVNPRVESLLSAQWRLADDVQASARIDAEAPFYVETRLHAVDRIPAAGRGKPAQFVPVRFIFRNKLTKDDKLLLAFDAFVLTAMLGRSISLGKVIHGDSPATLKVKLDGFMREVRKQIGKVAALLAGDAAPDLVLNRHCAECEFQSRCRKIAVEKDDLSLLAGMTAKERQELRSKGIFTVTQLSYTFRPRRRPKRLRNKREKYHHALKALAIREKKIHIVGSPELKIEGTPVYLDVEGLPDRDFYYLIGLRIGNGDTAVQHSLWADTVEDEGKIWRDLLAVLENVEKPVLIHYGSYETTFLRKMKERHRTPRAETVAEKAISSAINLVSIIFARIYFPTFSNGLKEIAKWLEFEWTEREASGVGAIAWRRSWEITGDPLLKTKLKDYNTQDCEALGRILWVIHGSITGLREARSVAARVPEVVEADAIDDGKLQKWRDFKSPLPQFEEFAKAAHWKRQHRTLIGPPRTNRSRVKHCASRPSKAKVYAEHVFPTSRTCPSCKKSKRGRSKEKIRHRLELLIGRASLKVRLVKYVFHTYYCRRCNLTFGQNSGFKNLHEFGWSVAVFLVYQVVQLNIAQRVAAESFSRLFGIPVSAGMLHELKVRVADYYRGTWKNILTRIASGTLAHVDETRIHLHDCSGYVWVPTNMHEVAYVFSPSREAELPKRLLSDFKGVLISDFYAAYDSLACEHQRCLIHLIRDLNDELMAHPFDGELKAIVVAFSELLEPIITTIERRGLKRRFLSKYGISTRKFLRQLACMPLTTEAARKCRQRIQANQDELFTFLKHDNVPWHNNRAEHAIKAVARLRNVVAGLSTEKGFAEYLILLSICQSCKYMGVDFLDFLLSGAKDIQAFAECQRPRRRQTIPPLFSPAESGASAESNP